jgi:hypothetical protein
LTEEDNAIHVQPGMEANIAVDRTDIAQKSKPYGDCYDISDNKADRTDLIDKTIKLSNIYTQQYCLQLCFEEVFSRNLKFFLKVYLEFGLKSF